MFVEHIKTLHVLITILIDFGGSSNRDCNNNTLQYILPVFMRTSYYITHLPNIYVHITCDYVIFTPDHKQNFIDLGQHYIGSMGSTYCLDTSYPRRMRVRMAFRSCQVNGTGAKITVSRNATKGRNLIPTFDFRSTTWILDPLLFGTIPDWFAPAHR